MRLVAARVVLRTLTFIIAIGCAVSLGDSARSQTLKTVKERGAVACGVSQGVLGFSAQSEDKMWTGIDADFCRALAAAIFDDPGKVAFVPALRRRPVSGASVEEHRRSVAQFDLDHGARDRARAALCRRELLRRSRLPGSSRAQCHQRARADRREGLRPERHDHRAQSARLFCRERDALRGGRDRNGRRGAGGVHRGALRCARQPTPRSCTASGSKRLSRAITTSCRKSSPRSRSGQRCARTMFNGSTS